MKNKIANFLWGLLMLVLFVFVIAIGVVIYLTINTSSSDIIYKFEGENYITQDEDKSKETKISSDIIEKFKLLVSEDKETQETINYSPVSSQSKFFYNQLNDYEKKIYNGLQENKENLMSGVHIINYGNTFSDVLSKENGGDVLGNYYQSAIEAFTHDNADLFYLDVNKMYLNIETTKKLTKTTYKVYISPKSGETYFANGFTNEEQVREALKQIEQEKEKIIATLSSNKYKSVVNIHDYIIDKTEYDETYSGIGIYSIYGVLVKKKAVCEGYAKTFKYILNSIGIECEVIQGTATNSSGKTESHAWNAVCLDDKWYLTDATWDDPIVIGNGTLTIRNKHKYLLKGSDSFKTDHKEERQFTENGKVFSYPEINKYDYK